MTAKDLLNSDISTLLRAARRAFDWWLDEITGLIPHSVRLWGTKQPEILTFNDSGSFDYIDGRPVEQSAGRKRPGRVTVLLPTGSAMVRIVTAPPMTRADFKAMLALNIERYFPLPNTSLLISGSARRDRSGEALGSTDVAALPLRLAEGVATAAAANGLAVVAIRIAHPDLPTPDPRFDFLPAMRGAGLMKDQRAQSGPWWICVAIFCLLNLAVAIWRDEAQVDRLQTLVDAQRPAVAVAQRIAGRIRLTDAIVHRATAERNRPGPLAILAQTTAAVPDGAWVQRYAWDRKTLRLTGYRARAVDVAAALRAVPRFTNVRNVQTDTLAETATGQPFDLTVELMDF